MYGQFRRCDGKDINYYPANKDTTENIATEHRTQPVDDKEYPVLQYEQTHRKVHNGIMQNRGKISSGIFLQKILQ